MVTDLLVVKRYEPRESIDRFLKLSRLSSLGSGRRPKVSLLIFRDMTLDTLAFFKWTAFEPVLSPLQEAVNPKLRPTHCSSALPLSRAKPLRSARYSAASRRCASLDLMARLALSCSSAMPVMAHTGLRKRRGYALQAHHAVPYSQSSRQLPERLRPTSLG